MQVRILNELLLAQRRYVGTVNDLLNAGGVYWISRVQKTEKIRGV